MSIRKLQLFGAAFGFGSHSKMTENSPAVLRRHGLCSRLQKICPDFIDAGDYSVSLNKSDVHNPKLKHLTEVQAFANKLYPALLTSLKSNAKPLVVGGDHTISIAGITAAKAYLGNLDLGLLWIDAHPDLNTAETSPSGNIHGMSVAISLGYGAEQLTNLANQNPKLKPEHVVYIGLRDVDPGERERIKSLGIKTYTMSDIDKLGIGTVMTESLAYLNSVSKGFLASFDLDVCDPSIAPGVGSPVRGGLTYREAHYVMECLADNEKLLLAEFVEFNPGMDSTGNSAEVVLSLLESLVGKKII